jgi:hypothetical protein
MAAKHPPGPPMRLGNMRLLRLALTLGFAFCGEARTAEAVYLSCSGTLTISVKSQMGERCAAGDSDMGLVRSVPGGSRVVASRFALHAFSPGYFAQKASARSMMRSRSSS